MTFSLSPIETYTPDTSLRLAGKAQHSSLGKDIQMLVWNVYKARRQNWMNDFQDLIYDQDLVILQEAVLNSRHDPYFEDNSRYEWVLARSFKDKLSGMETGVKTGAVTPSVNTRSIFSPHREPLSGTPKIVLSTCYRLDESDAQLLVLNVHAINFVTLQKYTRQLEQLKQEIYGHTGPVILAGDFNTWSAKRVRLFEAATRELGMQEAVMERPNRTRHFSRQLDHVYYRGLTLSHIRTLNSINSSDHFPISVAFSR